MLLLERCTLTNHNIINVHDVIFWRNVLSGVPRGGKLPCQSCIINLKVSSQTQSTLNGANIWGWGWVVLVPRCNLPLIPTYKAASLSLSSSAGTLLTVVTSCSRMLQRRSTSSWENSCRSDLKTTITDCSSYCAVHTTMLRILVLDCIVH